MRAKLSEGVGDIERKARALGVLLSSFSATARGGQGVEAMGAAYLSLMVRDPAWSVEEACHRIAKGEAETIDLRFCPTAPQVLRYVEMVQSVYRRELEDIEAIVEQQEMIGA